MPNYKKQMKYIDMTEKLDLALKNDFYYEAIFIEYAILEDRTKSMLKHAKFSEDTCNSKLNDKLNKIKNSEKFHDEYVRKHITNDLISSIHNWKNTRNTLNHDLINCEYTNEYVKKVALEGAKIVKKLCSKSTLVNKYFDKTIKSIL